ncbi:hypothetical protein U1Q18_011369 [Sarracenia purpurea var. burkii]
MVEPCQYRPEPLVERASKTSCGDGGGGNDKRDDDSDTEGVIGGGRGVAAVKYILDAVAIWHVCALDLHCFANYCFVHALVSCGFPCCLKVQDFWSNVDPSHIEASGTNCP